jgi:ribosomal protein L37AE/L43A
MAPKHRHREAALMSTDERCEGCGSRTEEGRRVVPGRWHCNVCGHWQRSYWDRPGGPRTPAPPVGRLYHIERRLKAIERAIAGPKDDEAGAERR